jgi:hypothetical protein
MGGTEMRVLSAHQGAKNLKTLLNEALNEPVIVEQQKALRKTRVEKH